jgi:hypothetical protein
MLAEALPEAPAPPPIRDDFMTFADALATLAREASWWRALKGDLQMHTVYSGGKEPSRTWSGPAWTSATSTLP